MTQKQIPILYSRAMALAKVEGRKDVTRRMVKSPTGSFAVHSEMDGNRWPVATDEHERSVREFWPWQVGATLWGKENYRLKKVAIPDVDASLIYCRFEADGAEVPIPNPKRDGHWHNAFEKHGNTLRPSIFMPKAVGRIWDEIVDVHIERLHDITEADAVREGVLQTGTSFGTPIYANYLNDKDYFLSPCDSYHTLWESINGKGSWDSNPWVWRIETRAIERPSEK